MFYATRNHLHGLDQIALGGRAAEELAFGEIITGAASDLQSCNIIARDMITSMA
jgi:cell division protease FtsH